MSSTSYISERLSGIVCTLSVATACGGAGGEDMGAEHNSLTSGEVEAGWQLLFDGETLDGWRGYNCETMPDAGWEVRDGSLVILQRVAGVEDWGGDIVTQEMFDDFELSLEFKVTDGANSGVFYRAVEAAGSPIWNNAPEFQLLDDSGYVARGATNTDTHLSGDNYDLHASGGSVMRPAGVWNQARLVVNRAHVEHWLNGVKTVEYELWSPDWEQRVRDSKFADYPEYGRATMGHIALQDHGNEVWFRNIKIRPIR